MRFRVSSLLHVAHDCLKDGKKRARPDWMNKHGPRLVSPNPIMRARGNRGNRSTTPLLLSFWLCSSDVHCRQRVRNQTQRNTGYNAPMPWF